MIRFFLTIFFCFTYLCSISQSEKRKIFAKKISDQSQVRLYLIKDKINLAKFVKQNIFGNKIVIGMGAGSISSWIKELPKFI